ncbi:MAG: hypothetical protein R6V10_07195 [bacterium]
MKSRAPIIIFLIVLPFLGVVAGAVAGASYMMSRLEEEGLAASPVCKCEYEPGLQSSMDELEKNTEAAREEMNSIRLQTAEIYNLLTARQGSTVSASPIRSALPDPYVQQVESFFKTPTALDLLASDVKDASDLEFGEPRFIAYNTITVPYTTGGREDFLILTIEILDYYDLKFQVLWDSREGG